MSEKQIKNNFSVRLRYLQKRSSQSNCRLVALNKSSATWKSKFRFIQKYLIICTMPIGSSDAQKVLQNPFQTLKCKNRTSHCNPGTISLLPFKCRKSHWRKLLSIYGYSIYTKNSLHFLSQKEAVQSLHPSYSFSTLIRFSNQFNWNLIDNRSRLATIFSKTLVHFV